MTLLCMEGDAAVYLVKAEECLLTAESEFANGRYNSRANRCYYACFQAAVAALIRKGIRPQGNWGHDFVQSQFVGLLINRRKRYDSTLRNVLRENQHLRDKADYRIELVSPTEAYRALRRTRTFVSAMQRQGESRS